MLSLTEAAALRPVGGSALSVSAAAVLPSNEPSKQGVFWLRLPHAGMSSYTFQTLFDKQIPSTACQVASNSLSTHSYLDSNLVYLSHSWMF
jgi:hypothetical protein